MVTAAAYMMPGIVEPVVSLPFTEPSKCSGSPFEGGLSSNFKALELTIMKCCSLPVCNPYILWVFLRHIVTKLTIG
jgi:hypothetical protein